MKTMPQMLETVAIAQKWSARGVDRQVGYVVVGPYAFKAVMDAIEDDDRTTYVTSVTSVLGNKRVPMQDCVNASDLLVIGQHILDCIKNGTFILPTSK